MSLEDRLGRAADESARLFDDVPVPTFPPARRHRPLAAVIATVILGASALAAVVFRSSPDSDLDTVASNPPTTASSASSTSSTSDSSTTAATATPTEASVRPDLVALDVEHPVPLRVFTVYTYDRNVEEVAVADLEAGTSTVYSEGAADISGLLIGAAMTSRRDLIAWTYDQGASLFSGDLSVADLQIGPDRDPAAGIGTALEIVPTPEGDALWVVQPGVAYGDIDVDTIVELIELPNGQRLASFTVQPNSYPAGATTAGLVLNTERLFDTGDGWITEPGSEQTVIVDVDGTHTEVGPGRAIATAADTIVRLVCTSDHPDSCELLIGDAIGSAVGPGNGTWSPVDGPPIPNGGMPLHPISPDGKLMLVAFGENPDANGTPTESVLYAVDLETRSARTIATFENRYPLATWTSDGRWIAVVNTRDITLYDRNDPASSFTVENAIPDNHYPFAAG